MTSPDRHPNPVRKLAVGLWRVPTSLEVGVGIRYSGLVMLALAVGSATLTFDWVVDHRTEWNFIGEFAGAVIYPSDILLVLGLSLWAIGWYLSPPLELRFGPAFVFVPLLLLMALTALSLLWTVYGPLAGFTAVRRFLLLALYVAMVTDRTRALVPMVTALFCFGILQAAVALGQVAEGSSLGLSALGELAEGNPGVGPIGAPRAYGLGFNPNPVGMFLGVVCVLAYCLFLLRASRWWTRAMTLGVFVVTFLGLTATLSRTALFSWILASLAVSLLALLGGDETRGTTMRRVALAVLLIALAGLLAQSLLSTKEAAGPSAQSTPTHSFVDNVWGRLKSEAMLEGLRNRFGDWRLSLPLTRDHIILGVGAGNHPVALKKRLSPDTFGGAYVPVHNVLILIVAELGVVGGIAWASLMAAPLVWVLSKRSVQRFEYTPLLWLGPLFALLFASLAEFGPWATQDARLLFPAVLGLWAGSGAAQTSGIPR